MGPELAPEVSFGVCVACRRVVDRWGPGPGGTRERASCPRCGSLERDRFLVLLLRALASRWERSTALEVAPGGHVGPLLQQIADHYVSIDVDPDADGRVVRVVTDLSAAGFRDASFDLIVCFHVLEHVPDDSAAMRELARLLTPAGVAVVQVPQVPGGPTDEDPSASREERIRRFGQADHVRMYGDDFEDRLRAAGLASAQLRTEDVLPEPLLHAAAIRPRQPVWLLTRKDAAGDAADLGLLDGAAVTTSLLAEYLAAVEDALASERADAARAEQAARAEAGRAAERAAEQEAARLRGEQEAAGLRAERDELSAELRRARKVAQVERERADRWRRDYRRLRARWPVRLLLRVARAARRLRR